MTVSSDVDTAISAKQQIRTWMFKFTMAGMPALDAKDQDNEDADDEENNLNNEE